MPLSLTIPKNPIYPAAMDWDLLRREGIRHIERLGSAIWTDYNAHDPGITMLEVLCYAITDLGYRTNLPIEDLLTSPSSNGDSKPFFTAAEMLTNHPVNALDYRKIIIDVPGVKNAWLTARNKPEVIFQLKSDPEKWMEILSIAIIEPYREIISDLSIFENFHVEFKDFIDLIKEAFHCEKSKEGREKLHELEISFLDHLLNVVVEPVQPEQVEKIIKHIKAIILYQIEHDIDEVSYFIFEKIDESHEKEERQILDVLKKILLWLKQYRIISKLTTSSEEDKKKLIDIINELLDEVINIIISIPDAKELGRKFVGQPLLCLLLKNSLIHQAPPEKDQKPDDFYNLFLLNGIYTILVELEDDWDARSLEVKQNVLSKLHRYRNLGEDFCPDIKVVEKQPIGICSNIEIEQNADPVKVLALIYQAVEEYLSPSVRFYTLQEMMDKYATFSLNATSFEDLSEALLPAKIITDLQTLEDKEYVGIEKYLPLIQQTIGEPAFEEYAALIFRHTQKKYNADPVYQGPLLEHGFLDEKELATAQFRHTVFKSDLYQVILGVEGVVNIKTLILDKCRQEDGTKGIKEDNWCLSFECDCLPELDHFCSKFSFTTGSTFFQVDPVLAIEHFDMLPMKGIKINRSGSMDIPVPRGVYHGELKNFTSVQVDFPMTYHVGKEGISSKEPPLRKAQMKQLKAYLLFYDQILANYLARLEQVREMLSIDVATGNDNPTHLYQPLYDVPFVKELLLDFKPDEQSWEEFMADEDNAYVAALKSLTEGSELNKQLRHNRILDHLLARFGEQFTDYTLNFYQFEKPIEEKKADIDNLADWMSCKKSFLQNLPTIGSQRARAYNYKALPLANNTHVWDSENVAGVKKRVSALLCLEDSTRHTITCQPGFVTDIISKKVQRTRRYQFVVKETEESKEILMLSTAQYKTKKAANQACQRFINQAAELNKFGVVANSIGSFIVGFWETDNRETNNALLISGQMFEEEEDAIAMLEEIKAITKSNCCDDSFHLVEHILLRPRDEHYKQLLKPMCCCLDRLDPYSFWVTIIVPEWVDRFRDPDSLYLFEQTIRWEMPAHVAIRICKYDQETMFDFETAYYKWLVLMADPDAEIMDIRKANDDLVELMNQNCEACADGPGDRPLAPTCLN